MLSVALTAEPDINQCDKEGKRGELSAIGGINDKGKSYYCVSKILGNKIPIGTFTSYGFSDRFC